MEATTLIRQVSPDEAYRKFDDLSTKHVEILRKLTKQVQEARHDHNDALVKQSVHDYDDAVENYIPVLMAQVYTTHCI